MTLFLFTNNKDNAQAFRLSHVYGVSAQYSCRESSLISGFGGNYCQPMTMNVDDTAVAANVTKLTFAKQNQWRLRCPEATMQQLYTCNKR